MPLGLRDDPSRLVRRSVPRAAPARAHHGASSRRSEAISRRSRGTHDSHMKGAP